MNHSLALIRRCLVFVSWLAALPAFASLPKDAGSFTHLSTPHTARGEYKAALNVTLNYTNDARGTWWR